MCAGCNVFELWASLLIGAVAGPVFVGMISEYINLHKFIDYTIFYT